MKRARDLGSNERDRALVVTDLAAREELAQPEPERLPVVEPPVERLAPCVDAVTSTKLDQRRLPKRHAPGNKCVTVQPNLDGRLRQESIKFCTIVGGIRVALPALMMRGMITELDESVEQAFPGILRYYSELTVKPTTFLELVWDFIHREAGADSGRVATRVAVILPPR